jgi:TnpA family transposase
MLQPNDYWIWPISTPLDLPRAVSEEPRQRRQTRRRRTQRLRAAPTAENVPRATVETAAILGQWTELMQLKASIEAGTVVPSVILRKLAAAGAGNALSRALRALGRIERTLFTLQWLSDPAMRQRSHTGLNKGEASNARRAVFFHRLGEIRDRTFENQSFRASGLSLITAAIVHWNTVYLDRAVRQLRSQGATVPDDLLAHVAPLGWEHIELTGDYVWTASDQDTPFRPLRDVWATFPPLAA